jgi:hypothetical protein
MRIVVIGTSSSRRTALFQAAVQRRGMAMVLIPWRDLINGHADLRQIVRRDDLVRIDSPGRDFETERLLLLAGRSNHAPWAAKMENLADDRGLIRWPALWYEGFCRVLDQLAAQLAACAPHRQMTDPADIQAMFDKTATHARLQRSGVTVPPAIGRVNGYDHLLNEMRDRRWERVFVKLAYGSSASGAIALRMSRRGMVQAHTTVEIDGRDEDGEPRLYNTRRIHQLSRSSDIARIVNAIGRHVAHAEFWIPKAGIAGRTFDIRVLVIAGIACHTVVRMSRTPMTNLHLLNDRADETRVRERCGELSWDAAMKTCRDAMAAFPQSLYAGVDLLIAPDFRRHAVLELNAFGDLLGGAMWRGLDPYDAELAAIIGEGNRLSATAEVA